MEVTGTKAERLSLQLSRDHFSVSTFSWCKSTFRRFLLVAIVVCSKISMIKEHFKYSYHCCYQHFLWKCCPLHLQLEIWTKVLCKNKWTYHLTLCLFQESSTKGQKANWSNTEQKTSNNKLVPQQSLWPLFHNQYIIVCREEVQQA